MELKAGMVLAPFPCCPYTSAGVLERPLIREGLSRLETLHARGCCLAGHPEYYRKFGFKNTPGLVLEGVPQEFFFALSFDENYPRGTVTFHKAFKATE